MTSALLNDADGLRTFALVLSTGDEVVAALKRFVSEQRLSASRFSAIGAFSDVVVAFFDWTTKEYQRRPITEQVEVLSLLGDVTLAGEPRAPGQFQLKPEPTYARTVHAHVVVGKADASAHGGHLIEAHVRPTLEIMLTELPRHLHRRFDPASGLSLIDPG